MTRKRFPFSGMALMMTMLVLGACGGGSGADGEPEDEGPSGDLAAADAPGAGGAGGPAAAGQQIFVGQGLCFTCHGQTGQGTPLAPNLTDSEWIWIQNPNDETELATLIRTGVSQPREYPAPMPPMGGAQLSEDQLNSVVAYVMSIAP